MNFERPSLIDMVRRGRSAVYVKSNKTIFDAIHDMLSGRGLHVLSVLPTSDVTIALDLWEEFPSYQINGIMLIRVPMLSHGCRYRADRMIWIGDERPTPVDRVNWPIYVQSMARGDMPWGQPAKWFYPETDFVSHAP